MNGNYNSLNYNHIPDYILVRKASWPYFPPGTGKISINFDDCNIIAAVTTNGGKRAVIWMADDLGYGKALFVTIHWGRTIGIHSMTSTTDLLATRLP